MVIISNMITTDLPQIQTIDITVSIIKHVDTDFEVVWRFWQLLLSILLFWWEEQELAVQKCCAIFASVYEAHLESKKRFKAKFSLEILISLHTWSGEGITKQLCTSWFPCEIVVVQSKIEWSYILFASLSKKCCYDNSVLIFCVVAACSFLPLIMYSSIKP